MVRFGVPVGGRVRKSRAVGDHSAHPLDETATKLKGGKRGQPGRPLARGTRALRRASFDARSRGLPRPLPLIDGWSSGGDGGC